MENNNSNIILKLRKLISHRDSAEAIGSLAEAEAFAARIQQLLSQHKLTISDVAAKEEEEKGATSGLAVDPTIFGFAEKDGMIPWLLKLAKTIAKVNDCELLVSPVAKKMTKKEMKNAPIGAHPYTTKATNNFLFVGVEADRVVAEEFYIYMGKLVWKLAKKAGLEMREVFRAEILAKLGECQPGHLSSKGHHYRHSFCKGFVDAVSERLFAEREKMKQAMQNQEMGLMVIDRRAVLVRTYMTKYAGKTPVNAEMYDKGGMDHGYILGQKYGQKVALTSKVVESGR